MGTDELRPPKLLRRLAWLLIRGPDALYILADLEQLAVREVVQGGSRWKASLRYFRNTLASAFSVWRDRLSRSRWTEMSLLDWKLALRMLLRYPGLTVVAGVAIAFAVLAGATNLELFMDTAFPRIPLDEGSRLVELRYQDRSEARVLPPTLHDFMSWREQLGSFQDLGAYRNTRRNVITEDGRTRSLFGAAMTAAAFGTARVPPLLGRPLDEADEVAEAPAVVVIAYDVWRSLFDADVDIVGQTVRIGSEVTTIVGVMPEDFGWPRAHDLWVPLRVDPLDFERENSPPVQVVARLRPGVSLRDGQTELTAVGVRTSARFPGTHEHLRPQVVRFGEIPVSISKLELVGAALFGGVGTFAAIMLLAWANVALLLFARTATRRRELVVRSALGASRNRIVTQLFIEALVLGGLAAGAGLWGTRRAVAWYGRVGPGVMEDITGIHEPVWGFWFDGGLSPVTITSTVVLTVAAAALSAIIPSVGTFGRDILSRLQRVHGAYPSRGWTTVIVLQIAVTVAAAPLGVAAGIGAAWTEGLDYGFRAEEYVTAELAMDGEFYSLAEDARREPRGLPSQEYLRSVDELVRRLAEEPAVRSVSRARQLPGDLHRERWFEVEGASAPLPSPRGHRAQIAAVDGVFFPSLGAPIVAGRGFDAVDFESGANVVVVNEEFVRRVLGDRNPVGRRIAFIDSRAPASSTDGRGPWHEIVGVVRQIAMTPPTLELPGGEAGIYLPLRRSEAYPVQLVVHVGPDAEAFASRLRALSHEIDPTLQVHGLQTLDRSASASAQIFSITSRVLNVFGAIALLLALAGIFSVMSLMVTRRTREIGVRVALGASRWRITRTIFSRAVKQVLLGVGAGAVLLVILLLVLVNSDVQVRPEPGHVVGLVIYVALMPGVCLLACLVPLRRAFRVEPTEALKEDG